MRNALFFLCFKSFLQINDLTPAGVGIYETQHSWLWQSFKYICFSYYLFAIFEILSGHPQFWFLVFLKCSFLEFQSYQIGIFYPLVDVSICFSPSLDFVLKAFSEVDIHFVLFEFVVVLLWETMTLYWIIWRPHHGDPMGITILKSLVAHCLSLLIINLFHVDKKRKKNY